LTKFHLPAQIKGRAVLLIGTLHVLKACDACADMGQL